MAKVLLVDDSPLLLKIGKALLEKEKHTVVTAKDGEEAVAAARKESPQIIFMDAEMPGMGGTEACRALKGEPATRAIPVYICTGHDLLGEAPAAFKKAGADGCLQKPFKAEDMLPLIEKAVKK
jgi:twitching motility two-component system response regulator PilH